jgi:hypothetical protein
MNNVRSTSEPIEMSALVVGPAETCGQQQLAQHITKDSDCAVFATAQAKLVVPTS